ncbi:MAG TPA: chemotaxis protein CheW [Sulfuricurvum sp.]|nr:chemotaxis protein CheW [Sulfuricurvum sp.]
MEDYIVFTVGTNYYALNVENVERIIQIPAITAIPNAHPFVDGMMSYEKRITKVVNFRKMTAMDPHEEDQTDEISGKSQKLLIYQTKESFFAIKVDKIDDMARIEPSMIKSVDSANTIGAFLELSGVVEMGERLVNVINSVSMPAKEVA